MTPEAWFDIEDGEAWLGGAPVLQSLSLQLRLGESTTVLGPNGAGKSSLVKLIDRSLHPIVKPTAHLKLFGSSTVDLWRYALKLRLATKKLNPLHFKRSWWSADVVTSGNTLLQVWLSAALEAMAPISRESGFVVWKARFARPIDHEATDGW